MHCHIEASLAETAMPAYLAPGATPTDTPAAWYVAYTEPRQENLAARNLQQQGFLTYLPLYKTMKKTPVRLPLCGGTKNSTASSGVPARTAAFEPMFPRYIFFKPSSRRQSISTVRSTRGIHSIIRFGADFALVKPEVLSAIQEHERQHNREDPKAFTPLRPGCRVRLNDPALDGLEGLVHSVSAQRVIVLMEILGGQTRVSLSQSRVELA